MSDRTLFSDLLISRPPRGRSPRRRAEAVGHAAALHLTLLGLAFLAPFLVLEAMSLPQAMSGDPPIVGPLRLTGGGSAAGAAMRGGPGGRTGRAPARADARRADRVRALAVRPEEAPIAPPEPNRLESHDRPPLDSAGRADAGGDPDGPPGGTGDGPGDGPGGCPGCRGDGPDQGSHGPGGYDDIVDPGDPRITRQPVLIPSSRALPAYPEQARRARVEGTVVMMIVIRADGTVGEIEVIRAPDPVWGFDLAAIQSVRRWRYVPALMAGRPVTVYAQVMVEFTVSR
jgi:TonB family protein